MHAMGLSGILQGTEIFLCLKARHLKPGAKAHLGIMGVVWNAEVILSVLSQTYTCMHPHTQTPTHPHIHKRTNLQVARVMGNARGVSTHGLTKLYPLRWLFHHLTWNNTNIYRTGHENTPPLLSHQRVLKEKSLSKTVIWWEWGKCIIKQTRESEQLPLCLLVWCQVWNFPQVFQVCLSWFCV